MSGAENLGPWAQNRENAARTRFAIPPLRCNATANRTGQQCKHWATPGSTKCYTHSGAAPQVRRAAKARVTAATIQAANARLPQLLDEQPRPPWSAILDAGATVDAVARDLRAQVLSAGPAASPELVDRMVTTFKTSHSMSEAALRLGLVKLLVSQEGWTAEIVRATLLGVVDALLERLGASDQPALKLFCIRAAQAALSTPELSRPQDPEGSRHAGRADAAKARLEPAAHEAVRKVPWPQDVDLVITTRSELDELARLRQQERERQLATKAIAAAPFTPSVPVMQHPDGRTPWRGLEDVEAPVLQETDDDEDADHDVAVAGRIVDGSAGPRWPYVPTSMGWGP